MMDGEEGERRGVHVPDRTYVAVAGHIQFKLTDCLGIGKP